MYYDTKLFGARLKLLRKKLKLTQEEVAVQAGLNISTVRRIESGSVIPKLETLEFLSPVLKEDLHLMFMQHRIDDYDFFYKLKTRLENKIDNDDFDKIEPELQALAMDRLTGKNDYYRRTIDQLLLLISAAISYKKNKDPDQALALLVQAIKYSTPDFELASFRIFTYSDIELRILMNIASVQNCQGHKDQYLDILVFCGKIVNPLAPLYPKILYNLAGAYLQGKHYQTALEHTEKAINWCLENRVYAGLPLMHYNKGLCQYYLSDFSFASTFKKAIFLAEIYGQTSLREKMIAAFADLWGEPVDA